MRKVAHLCGISCSSVTRIAQGDVNKCSLRPASRKGRPRKLMERQAFNYQEHCNAKNQGKELFCCAHHGTSRNRQF